jgi:hypothetical protein
VLSYTANPCKQVHYGVRHDLQRNVEQCVCIGQIDAMGHDGPSERATGFANGQCILLEVQVMNGAQPQSFGLSAEEMRDEVRSKLACSASDGQPSATEPAGLASDEQRMSSVSVNCCVHLATGTQ